ncbi:stromal membrane-associated protein 1 isoform X2 [Rhinatrema bivittatum]|uniref:stromal membrane-associated protein 1 isoform X2 n=1 Tax=Rhinatrema bivittatum TaxID=194408 RepID=UPI00112E0EF3|nr:stromal membrane-associated protein 1 isoform X2 [Rhinatrema bivittatum]
MTTRSEREKAQKLNEQHQAILSRMLREEDNKYCADCEAKGPRWASWNIGVFICIRCAGIHRNLGVHISRVKSVNLDQWTPEQIQQKGEVPLLRRNLWIFSIQRSVDLQPSREGERNWDGSPIGPMNIYGVLEQRSNQSIILILDASQCMQDMGNTKARLCYEANLPENFRRPQTDQSVEFFIRDKYERKKYYDKSAANAINMEKDKRKEDKKRDRESEKPPKSLATEKPTKKEDQQLELKPSPKKAAEPTIDLLGLDGPAEAPVTNGSTTSIAALNDDLDIFGPMISNPLPTSTAQVSQGTSTKPAAAPVSTASGDLDLFTEQTAKSDESAKKQLSKDSILSLYGTGTMPQQNAPSMFMASSVPFPSQPSANFPGFPPMGVPMPSASGMMGNVMGQNTSMMVGMGVPNGFVGNVQAGVMGLPPNMLGPQAGMVGSMSSAPNKYGMQQSQQAPWNLSQMNQQMAGMNLNSPGTMMGFGQPASTVGGWAANSTGQTLSTQLWK